MRPCEPSGSSPLTRGKRESYYRRDRYRGLIPAHAGKTSARAYQRACCAAHPRSRGENPRRRLSCGTRNGSSPLTRGKRWICTHGCSRPRLIPAHAGKTTLRVGEREFTSAHPRSRGENHTVPIPTLTHNGSSPLTRGKHRAGRVRAREAGLIPAHAGKTGVLVCALLAHRAHPRSRGENARVAHQTQPCNGSSPLTRGKPKRRRLCLGWLGLIPAHAGKTMCVVRHIMGSGAHPRSRGENTLRLSH